MMKILKRKDGGSKRDWRSGKHYCQKIVKIPVICGEHYCQHTSGTIYYQKGYNWTPSSDDVNSHKKAEEWSHH